MKTVIVCLNSKYIHASLAPWCLYAAVKDYCNSSKVQAKVLESTVNASSEEFVKNIISEKPDTVAFCCYIWNIEKTLSICETLKEKIGCRIILGGPEVSFRAKSVLDDYSFVDFVISGEGEESFSRLLENIADGGDLSAVSGLSYRESGVAVSIPPAEYKNTPVSPYCDEFFDNLGNRIAYIETSRGCPYNCAFCLSGSQSKLRFFDFEKIKGDIIHLANSGTKTVKFVDRTFNANADRANEILSFLISAYGKEIPETVCFHFEIAGDILKNSTFDILEKAPKGYFQLEIGMQSFNEDTLKCVNRKTDTQKLIENIKRLISFGNMHIHIDLIAGLTGEDFESFKRSFNIGFSLGANMLQMGFLKLLYGSQMRENKEKYPCEFNEKPPYEVTQTPWLSKDEIVTLKRCEDALERMYNSGRFLFTVEYLINECDFAPFDLFCGFGNAVDGTDMSLSDYAVEIYEYFSDFSDKELLRENLICDLLSCSSALQIPEVLKRKDPFYRRIKKHFAADKTGLYKAAILYKTNRVFAVDQKSEKDFRGRYRGEFYPLDELRELLTVE